MKTKITISVDQETNYIIGWGSQLDNNENVLLQEIEIESTNDFFKTPFLYKYENGALLFSKEKEIQEAKQRKLLDLNNECKKDITDGFLFPVGENTYHISYDQEAQQLLQETKLMFDMDIIENIGWTCHKGNDTERITFNKEGFLKLYLISISEKQSKISRLKDTLEPLVNESKSIEEINNIVWKEEG